MSEQLDEAPEGELNALRREASDRALFASGTGHIFERRARRLRYMIALLASFGIAVPVLVGAAAAGYGLEATFLPIVLNVAAALGGIQLVISIWALARNWSGNMEAAGRSVVANDQLAKRFESLSKTAAPASEVRHQFELAIVADDAQQQQDHFADLSEREKRRGMRYGLLRQQRPCAQCGIVPTSMKSTRCGVCGDF